MSIGDANDVQTLVQYLFDCDDRYGRGKVPAESARESALRLADRSSKVLMAGFAAADLADRRVRS